MIIYKLDSFYTDEDRAEAKRLSDNLVGIQEKIHRLSKHLTEEEYKEEYEAVKREVQQGEEAIEELHQKIKQRYIDSYKDNPEAIYTTIAEVLEAYTLEDFTTVQRRKAESYKQFNSNNEDVSTLLKDVVKENFANCYSQLFLLLSTEFSALGFYGLDLEKAKDLIEIKARSFYPKRTRKKTITLAEIEKAEQEVRLLKPFVAMLNGPATNELTSISTRSNRPEPVRMSGEGLIQQGSVSVFIDSYKEITGELRTSTHKLLDALTMVLTQQNNYRGKETDLKPTVSIPLEHFMELCGIPLTKPSKDKTRKKVKEDLETLYHLSLKWTEASGQNTRDFAKMRLCDKIGIVKGSIVFSFSQDMANYLTNAYIMQYPIELLKVDERNPNSYHIGKKLLLHNSIDNNRAKGTNNRLSVLKLLEACPDIPDYEQVLNSDRALDRRIKTPLEAGLDSLPFVKWEYCTAKGVPLTDEEAQAINFNTFKQLYIQYEVIGGPDQTPRLERKRERKEQSKENAKRTQRKKANK